MKKKKRKDKKKNKNKKFERKHEDKIVEWRQTREKKPNIYYHISEMNIKNDSIN